MGCVSVQRDISIQTIYRGSQNPARTPYANVCIAHIAHIFLPTSPFSLKIVLIDLIRHHHHPQQEHRPHDVERKRRLPVLTDPLRLQPRQRRLPVRQARARPVEVAVAVDGALGPVELDGRLDQAGEEEHEEDEGAEDDDAGEQLPLLDQDEDDEQEEQAEGAGGYAVGEYPETGGN